MVEERSDLSPEFSVEKKSVRLTRRQFLGTLAALLSALALRSSEMPLEYQLSLTSLRIDRRRYLNDEERGYGILTQLGEFLKKEPVNLVVMPEGSFEMYDEEVNPLPLVIEEISGGQRIHESTHPVCKHIIEEARSIATRRKCHLLLGTFYEIGLKDNQYRSTLLHIDSSGEIVGIKRKFYPPVGSFTIEVARGVSLKILPLICGEAWREKEVPWWVRQNGPYDILTHSLSQGDVDFDQLSALVQGLLSPEPIRLEERKRLKDAFYEYYGKYLPYLKPRAPIVVSDWGMSGIFTKDLKPLENYTDVHNYTLVKQTISPETLSGR